MSEAYLESEIQGQKRQFPLTQDRICRIGRSDKNTIVLDDDLASRSHAMLQASETGQFYLTDLGSSNGTLVNGARISVPAILHNGDRVTIGNHEFTFQQVTEQAPPPAPAAEDGEELQSTNVFFAVKLISVLVMDIRDFTGLAQRVEPAVLSQITGTFFREAGRTLQQRGAWAQKYIGDAVMALWIHKKREPELRDLISMFSGLSDLVGIAGRLQSQLNLAAPVKVGAGVNTGWASVGNVGSIASSDYTALGDVVNKAFRLETATKQAHCELLIGQGTYDFLAATVDLKAIFNACTVELKGYEKPETAHGAHFDKVGLLVDSLNRAQAIAG